MKNREIVSCHVHSILGRMLNKFNDSVIHSKILVNYFKEMCKSFTPPYRDECLPVNQNKADGNLRIMTFLLQMKRLINEEKCDIQAFKSGILNINKLNLVHLEILWYLQEYNLMQLNEILQHYETTKNEELVEHISLSINSCLLDQSTKQSLLKRKMVLSYMKVIFSNIQEDEEQWTKNFKYSIQETVLHFITTRIREFYSSRLPDSYIDTNKLNIQDFISLLSETQLECSALSIIYKRIVTSLLEGSPQTIKNIFKTQEKLQGKVKDEKVYNFFITIANYCELDTFINLLRSVLVEKSKTINWNIVVVFISFIGKYYADGWNLLRKLSDHILNQAFLKHEIKLLACTFVIARLGCSEKPKNAFSNYMQWFGSTFSTKSAPTIKTKESCIFLFDFLTDLVSIDCVKYLKVHINRPPIVPSDCQFILIDFTTLVKTQLSDLNASSELGICENYTDKSAAVFDVETIIQHFEKTGTILNSVFQAAMFNRSYYEKKFLVELLSTYDGKNSARHKIIQKLNSLGKIPKSIYNKYKAMGNK